MMTNALKLSILLVLAYVSAQGAMHAQDIVKPQAFKVKVFVGEGSGDETSLDALLPEDASRPGVIVFINSTDSKVLNLAKTIGLFVQDSTKSEKPNFKMVYLAKDDESDAKAKEAVATAELGFPVYVFSGDGPEGYDASRECAMTVVMWSKSGIVKPNNNLTLDEINDDNAAKVLLKFIDVMSK